MATDLTPQHQAPAAPKYETFVEQQFARALRRVRKLDTLASLLTLGIAALIYALTMAALDRALTLPLAVRGTALIVFLLGACIYGAVIVFRQVRWTVNPYYAAKRLEATVHGAKNSLINWLDLRGEAVPSAIRAHLGRRAEHDLKSADFDHAINGRRVLWLGGILGGLFLVLAIWYVMGPGQLASLLHRAFAPFEKVSIATRTEIMLLAPEHGDATVPVRQEVRIRVKATGRVPRVNQPDSLRLHLRYRPEDPYIVRPLDPDADGEWSRTVVADEVQTGFWYKITGGDAETPEYQVRVRALPQVTRFEVKYKFRPYLGLPDREFTCGPTERQPRPDLRAPRGTEVTLVAHTNRPWHEGKLVLHEGGPEPRGLPGKAVDGDPQARSFHFVLDHSGQFQMLFKSAEGEANSDRGKYEMVVFEDRKPAVWLNLPGKDVTLPANGTLPMAGHAEDDYGLTAMTLRMQIKDGPQKPDLAPQPYRPGLKLRLADGSYPRELDYKDLVALEKLKTPKGEAVSLAPGSVLEYWLEAVDNCDYPEPGVNVGKSRSFLVKIADPNKDEKKQQEERRQAEQGVKEHQKQQDQQLENQDQRAAQRKKEKQLSQEEQQKLAEKRAEEFKKNAEQLAKALEEKRKEEEKKGTVKGEEGQSGDPKGGAQKGSENKTGNTKPDPKEAAKKEAPQQPQAGQQGNSKGEGQNDPQAGPKSQAKNDKGDAQQNNLSADKGAGPPDPKAGPQQQGVAKDEGSKEKKSQAAQAKEGNQDQGGEQQGGMKDGAGGKQDAAQAKKDGKKDAKEPAGQQAQGGAKDGPQQQQQAADKQQDPGGTSQQASNTKSAGKPEAGKPTPQGGTKSQEQNAKGISKQDDQEGKGGQPNASAKDSGPKQTGSGSVSGNKSAAAEQSANAGSGKADRDPDPQKTAADQRRNATKDDLAKLEKELQNPDRREEAVREIEKLSQDAGDKGVREAARDLLKKEGGTTGQGQPDPKEQVSKGVDELLKKLGSDDPQVKKGAEELLDKILEQGGKKQQGTREQQTQEAAKELLEKLNHKDEQVSKGAQELVKKLGDLAREGEGTGQQQTREPGPGDPRKVGEPGGVGPDSARSPDSPDYRGDPYNQEASKRAGELQLENIKKKLAEVGPNLKRPDGTPWTEADKQRFLEQARDYLEWTRQQGAQAATEKQAPQGPPVSVLPNLAPSLVNRNPNATRDPLDFGSAQPPPEYREAQKLFSSSPKK